MTEQAQTILTVAMDTYTANWLSGLFFAALMQRSGLGPMRSLNSRYILKFRFCD